MQFSSLQRPNVITAVKIETGTGRSEMDRGMVSCSWMESGRVPRGGDSYKKLQMKVRICLLEQLLVWRLGNWIKCPFFFFCIWSLMGSLDPLPADLSTMSLSWTLSDKEGQCAEECPGWNFKACRLSPQYGELLTLSHITTTERAQSHPHLTLLFSPSHPQTLVSTPAFLRIPACILNTHSFISIVKCHLSQPLNAFLGGWSEPASGRTDQTEELVGLGEYLRDLCEWDVWVEWRGSNSTLEANRRQSTESLAKKMG